MASDRATAIPKAALMLGWLGVTPFAGFAMAIAAGWPLAATTGLRSLVFYGAVILSFMGGVQWGLALRPAADRANLSSRLVISVLPAIVAWASVALLPMLAATSVLATAFALLLVHDIATVRRGLAPPWYTHLRAPLTAVVIVCLLIPMAVLVA